MAQRQAASIMIRGVRTRAARAYVTAKRGHSNAAATWFDVADAYDAGLRHAVLNRDSAKRAFAQMEYTAVSDAGVTK